MKVWFKRQEQGQEKQSQDPSDFARVHRAAPRKKTLSAVGAAGKQETGMLIFHIQSSNFSQPLCSWYFIDNLQN